MICILIQSDCLSCIGQYFSNELRDTWSPLHDDATFGNHALFQTVAFDNGTILSLDCEKCKNKNWYINFVHLNKQSQEQS